MFSMHGRGDLVQFLESQGFVVDRTEDTEDLRAAACMHAQVIAMQRSPVFRDVVANAERMIRKVSFELAHTIDEQIEDLDDDPDGNSMFLGW
tara:strand:+ start:369 stop:644 length:276 start_codon:yes stop_codon:yes gene_type:complete